MNQEKISEDYFEFMLKKALAEYAEEKGKYLQEENENIKEPDLSKKYNKSIKNIAKNIRKNHTYNGKSKVKAATVVFAIMFSGAAVTYTVDANFKSFINKLFTQKDTYINITYYKSNLKYDFSKIPESWEYFYIPEYIPEGYNVEEIKADEDYIFISYVKGDSTIDFNQRKGYSKLSIDNEHSELIKTNISGDEALIQKHDALTIIYWDNSDFMFEVSGAIDDEELIKIAESIYSVGR